MSDDLQSRRPARWTRALLGWPALLTVVAFAFGLLVAYHSHHDRTFQIASGSMAATLLGPHYLSTCDDCRYRFPHGIETPPPLGRVVCPNCGSRTIELASATVHKGDSVTLDRRAFKQKNPQRWDLVAFVDPTDARRLAVKRVVGLPGEQVAIRDGDVYIDQSVLRKEYEVAKQLSTIVHDDRHRPASSELPPRWASDRDDSGWSSTAGGYTYRHDSPADVDFDWLTYRHWRCYGAPQPRTDESPVTDNQPYNQGLSRTLRHVRDLRVRFDLAISDIIDDEPQLAIILNDGRNEFVLTLALATGEVELKQDNEPIHSQPMRDVTSKTMQIDFGVIDQSVLLSLNGRTCWRQIIQGSGLLQPTSRPLGIAIRGADATVSNLVVQRDIHYLDPPSRGKPWGLSDTLADDEYFLLGDNSPLSRDSRHHGPITRQQILGRVSRVQ